MTNSSLRKSLVLMMLFSALLLLWHSIGMNRVYHIDRANILQSTTLSDSNQGGNSRATFRWTPKGGELNCEIKEGNQWPYCEISFQIGTEKTAVDLSKFDSAKIHIESTGEGPQNIKIYLRQYNPAYSSADKNNSLKVNQIQYDANTEQQPLNIPLNTFMVPTWWLNEMKLSPLQSAHEIDHVTAVEVATGDFRNIGHHSLIIKGIEFHGKWLPYSQLASGILTAWLMYALALVASSTVNIRSKVISERRTKEALLDINKALSLEKLELQEQAQRDHLTQVYNRFGLRQHLLSAVEMLGPDTTPFSLILIDIDYFKAINDQHGHDIGDEVLIQFSQVLSRSTRQSDTFGRWGGEEFILLCPESRLKPSCTLAENIRTLLCKTQWPLGIELTCSFGVAEVQSNESISSVIKRADNALYQAKEKGRNRVEYDSSTPRLY